jgi:hypothetical protein
VGKTALAEALASALPGVRLVPEPYEALLDDGHIFQDPPAVEDFEVQLGRSLSMSELAGGDLIFDRAPADFLAYLRVVRGDHREHGVDAYWDEVVAAMDGLDLVVYLPVERVDRIEVPESEYPRLRRRVDRELRRLLVDNELGISGGVLEVQGPLRQRANRVLGELARLRQRP